MPTSKITYGVAHPDVCDIQGVYDICTEAAMAINGTVNEQDLLDEVDSFYYSEDLTNKIMLVALNEENVPIGVLGAIRIPKHFLYGDKLVLEQVLWVTPEYRKTRAFLRLIKGYETWAERIGATHILLSDIHGNEKLQKLYQKKGYTPTETTFIKELN